MERYSCVFYTTLSERSPIEEFISSLSTEGQEKFIFRKELLEGCGHQLRFPHTEDLGNGILELRFKGREGQIRVLFFFFYGKKIVFTNGFVKKTQKTPPKEIDTAIAGKKDYLERHR